MGASEEAWEGDVDDTLWAPANHVRRGVAFNLLTTYVDWRKEAVYYADPARFFDFCRREPFRYVTLAHDHPLYEWTMLVHKEAP